MVPSNNRQTCGAFCLTAEAADSKRVTPRKKTGLFDDPFMFHYRSFAADCRDFTLSSLL
jgi:hypothetical protein